MIAVPTSGHTTWTAHQQTRNERLRQLTSSRVVRSVPAGRFRRNYECVGFYAFPTQAMHESSTIVASV